MRKTGRKKRLANRMLLKKAGVKKNIFIIP
jgi:hypothetical protein